MTWAQKTKSGLEAIERQQIAKLKAAGFEITRVSAEEHEDGIGACVGVNAIKNGVWYTMIHALREIGERVDFMKMAREQGLIDG